jgi:hypothetical protein
MNVYGLDSAKRTIHILFGFPNKASSGAQLLLKLFGLVRRIHSLYLRFAAAALWVRRGQWPCAAATRESSEV